MARKLLNLSRAALPALGIFLVVVVAATSLGQGVPQQAPLGEGPPAVEGVGTWLNVPAKTAWADGQTLRFDRLSGQVVVLEFWTTWCPGCTRAKPTLEALQKKYAKKGLVVVGVTVPDQRQDTAKIKAHVKASIKHPVAVLQTAAAVRAYGVGKIPYAVVVGRDGKVAWKGNPDVKKAAFKTAVKTAIKAKAKAPKAVPASQPASQPASRPAR